MDDSAARPFMGRRFLSFRLIPIATALVALVVVNVLAFGQFSTVLENFFRPTVERSAAVTEMSADLTEEIEGEGIVLLRNEEGALPLTEDDRRVNVFGWSSTSPVFGGTGSGAVDTESAVSFLQGLENAGIEYNSDITDFYSEFRTDRPLVEIRAQDWTVPEPSMAEYDEARIFESAEEYSDTAIVMVARSGGEGADLGMSLGGTAGEIEEQELPDGRTVNVGSVGSDYEDDIDPDKHYLELSNREQAMLERVRAEHETVIVLLNTGNVVESGFLEDMDIDAAAWIGGPGETGFDAVGRVLTGEVNPSGRAVDTWARDLMDVPSVKNFGRFTYTGSEDVDTGDVDISWSGDPSTAPGFQFLRYSEGIYVGYRFYETYYLDDEEGYARAVQYPFGYGLSYTTFDQELGELERADGTVSVDVTVTNTGDRAGKEVVQLYATPPYTEGGIEKSAKELVAFDKTDVLDPGASQTMTLSLEEQDLASFDSEGTGGYVLEAGEYQLHLSSSAHEEIASEAFTVEETVTYDEDSPRDGDRVAAASRFEGSEGDTTVLSRADDFANFDQAVVQAEDQPMSPQEEAQMRVTIDVDDSAQMPTTEADGDLELADLRGADYDDDRWEQLLDQMSVEEMRELVTMGGHRTAAVPSIDKDVTNDIDGPQGLSSFMGSSVRAGAFPTAMVIASTWNTELAQRRGDMVGIEALELGVSGWYAPGMNLHRSPFGGRNFEYYSEDPHLTGQIASHEVRGAQERGLYTYIKHFVANEQETYRNSRLVTWVDEQTLREIYLPAFEDSVKEGGATAVMSAYNYLGGTWAGADPRLLQGVLREEWGFQGMVITDYFGDYGYLSADWAIANGGDMMLSTLGQFGAEPTGDDAQSVQWMRQASHNILYTVANSNAMYSVDERNEILAEVGGEVSGLSPLDRFSAELGLPTWQLVAIAADIVLGIVLVVLTWRTIRTYRRRSGEQVAR